MKKISLIIFNTSLIYIPHIFCCNYTAVIHRVSHFLRSGFKVLTYNIKMAEDTSAAWPIADEALAQSLLDLVQQAAHYRQLKKVCVHFHCFFFFFF